MCCGGWLPLWSKMWSTGNVRAVLRDAERRKRQCFQGFRGFWFSLERLGCYMLPNQARYQTSLNPDALMIIAEAGDKSKWISLREKRPHSGEKNSPRGAGAVRRAPLSRRAAGPDAGRYDTEAAARHDRKACAFSVFFPNSPMILSFLLNFFCSRHSLDILRRI